MRLAILIPLTFISGLIFAQTKKEQIEILNSRVDSLSSVLASEREIRNTKETALNLQIGNLESAISGLQSDLREAEDRVKQKEQENKGLNVVLNDQSVQISDLKFQLKIKSDSLVSLLTEIGNREASDTGTGGRIPENDYDNLSRHYKNKGKDVTEQRKWVSALLTNPNHLTTRCEEYLNDINESYWGYDGTIDEETVRKKWSHIYDLKYGNFGHIFEAGNCGWVSKQITTIEYLGEVNEGDWFNITIKGGCFENDYSTTLVRVIKVIREDGVYLIDNVVRMSEE